jgi:hypothetical protein
MEGPRSAARLGNRRAAKGTQKSLLRRPGSKDYGNSSSSNDKVVLKISETMTAVGQWPERLTAALEIMTLEG